MKRRFYALVTLTMILGGVAMALWLSPTLGMGGQKENQIGFGIYEGKQLVCHQDSRGNTSYSVEDAEGNTLFRIPLRGCMLDTRYRNGRLRFREDGTMREGYIDTDGMVAFIMDDGRNIAAVKERRQDITEPGLPSNATRAAAPVNAKPQQKTAKGALDAKSLKAMTKSHPFYKEAAKVLAGHLNENDADRRTVILNYCEYLRTAYTTKDIGFIKQVFSEQALIIIGNVTKTAKGGNGRLLDEERTAFFVRTKKEYIANLSRAFTANRAIDVRFSDFKITRHPTMDGIYGVSMRQRYHSDKYSDDGYLFLLWDFRDKAMPLIHVRTWQPNATIGEGNPVMAISDFNLE